MLRLLLAVELWMRRRLSVMRCHRHPMGCMGVVDGLILHVGKSIGTWWCLTRLLVRLGTEIRAGASYIVPRRWTGTDLRLWGMLSMMERDTVGNGRGGGGVSQVGVIGWVLHLRGEAMRDGLFGGWCAVIVVVVVDIVTAAEVGWSFMFVRTTILHRISSCQGIACSCPTHILKPSDCFVYISRRKLV